MISADGPSSASTAGQTGDRNHLSYSAVRLFQTCPLRLYFKYLARLPEETVSVGLVFGSALHRAVQHHFEQLQAGLAPPSLNGLRDAFWEAWYAHGKVPIRFGKCEDLQTIGVLADRLLRLFRQSSVARPSGTIVGVEKEIRARLLPGLPELVASSPRPALTGFSTWSAPVPTTAPTGRPSSTVGTSASALAALRL